MRNRPRWRLPQPLRVEEKPSDEHRLSVVHAPAGQEPKQGLALLGRQGSAGQRCPLQRIIEAQCPGQVRPRARWAVRRGAACELYDHHLTLARPGATSEVQAARGIHQATRSRRPQQAPSVAVPAMTTFVLGSASLFFSRTRPEIFPVVPPSALVYQKSERIPATPRRSFVTLCFGVFMIVIPISIRSFSR